MAPRDACNGKGKCVIAFFSSTVLWLLCQRIDARVTELHILDCTDW